MNESCYGCHPDLRVAARGCGRCLRRLTTSGLWAYLTATVPVPTALAAPGGRQR